MEDKQRFILIGRLGRARGVSGEIYVTPLTDFPERFLVLKEVFIDERGTWRRTAVENVREIAGRPVLKLAGVDSIEDAKGLTNRDVAVTDKQLVELPEGSHWVFDLIGCDVFDEQTEERIGNLTDVLKYPANDVYLIRDDEGADLMLPAISEYVTLIDPGNRKIVVRSSGLVEQGSKKKQ